jgi:hypothetical protein
VVSARRLVTGLATALVAGLSLLAFGACDLVLGLPDRHFDPHVDCTGGDCVCAAGYADCDAKPDNGCEADLGSAADCGGCGHVCDNGACTAGACGCDQDFSDCDGKPQNGCEVSLLTDVDNCGACGHACLGGACQDGACQPIVVGKFVMPQSLGLAQGSLYVGSCEKPAIAKIPVGGGAVTTAVSSTHCVFLMSIVGDTIYWADDTDVYASPLAAPATPKHLVPNSNSELFFAASPSHVYWYSFDTVAMTQALMRVPTAGGPPENVAPDAQVNDLITDATHAYWADQGGVHSIPHAGGASKVLYTNSVLDVLAIGVDADSLYIGDTQGVRRQPLAGGAPTMLADASFVDAIAVDATHVYWADQGDGSLAKVPRGGGATTVVATGQTFDMGMRLFVDDQAVYWIADQQVRKVAK